MRRTVKWWRGFSALLKEGIAMNKVVSIAAAGVIIGSLATGSMALEISAGIKGGLGIANLRGSDA